MKNEIKIAKTENEVIDLIKNRWSARSFAEKSIPKKELHSLIEAGMWAFSANNEQPWRIILAEKGSENFEKVASTLMPGNFPWAKNAAAFVVSLAKTTFEKEGNPINVYADHDLGAFNAFLILQAQSQNIYAHPMAGFDKQKMRELFQLNENLKPMVIIALGYLDDAEKLDEPYKTRELTARSRKTMHEIVING